MYVRLRPGHGLPGFGAKLGRIDDNALVPGHVRDRPVSWMYVEFSTILWPHTDLIGFYLLGMWYKRSEAQKRFSFFFSSTTLAGAFGGLLAYGLGQMDGLRGYSGWRWVFIIEGVLTCVVAIGCFFVVPDFPEDAKWLTEDERAFLRDKLAKDVGKSAADASMTWRDIAAVFTDCRYPWLRWR